MYNNILILMLSTGQLENHTPHCCIIHIKDDEKMTLSDNFPVYFKGVMNWLFKKYIYIVV